MSAIESEADVSINIRSEDSASLEIDQATKRINKSFSDMRQQQRQATREFEVNNRVLVQSGRVLSSLGRVVSRTIAIYNTFQLHQLRLGQANDRLTATQKDLNEAFLEFGEGRETADIRERMIKEREDMKRLQDETLLIVGLAGLQAVSLVGSVISRILPQVQRLKGTVAGIGGGAGVASASRAPVPFVGSTGGSGKLSKVAKGAGILAGAGLIFAGVSTSQFANQDRELSTEEKLMSLGESTLGGAITGATIGSVVPVLGTAVGGAIGAGAGFGVGVATNFGGEITDFFNGDEPAPSINRRSGQGVQITNNVFSPSSQQTVDDIADNTVQSLPFGNQ